VNLTTQTRTYRDCNETIMAATSQEIISPIKAMKPELPLSAPSINPEPVELDSTPASPEKCACEEHQETSS